MSGCPQTQTVCSSRDCLSAPAVGGWGCVYRGTSHDADPDIHRALNNKAEAFMEHPTACFILVYCKWPSAILWSQSLVCGLWHLRRLHVPCCLPSRLWTQRSYQRPAYSHGNLHKYATHIYMQPLHAPCSHALPVWLPVDSAGPTVLPPALQGLLSRRAPRATAHTSYLPPLGLPSPSPRTAT